MLRRVFLQTAVVSCATALLAGSALAQQFKWDMPNEYGATTLPGQADAEFAELVKQKSNGQIEITVHFDGALLNKSGQHFAAVEDGAVPLASTFSGTFMGMDPIWTAQSLPFLATDPKESRALQAALEPYMDRAFRRANQFYLYSAPWTPVGIWAREPITSIDAIQGLKIRTYDANGTSTMKAAGAAAIQLSWADVIPAFSTGTIDAVLTSDEGGVSAKFWEHVDHFTALGFTMGMNTIHMNLDVFDSLSPDLQKAVLDAAKEAEDAAWARTDARIEANFGTMEKNGVTVVDVADVPQEVIDHLRKAGEPLMDEWVREIGVGDADKILADYKQKLTM